METLSVGCPRVLYERGLISDPKSKAKSVVLTKDGLAEAANAFETLLATQPAGCSAGKESGR